MLKTPGVFRRYSNFWRKLLDCNGIRTHNHLVRKRTLNRLAEKAFDYKLAFTFIQLQSVDSL